MSTMQPFDVVSARPLAGASPLGGGAESAAGASATPAFQNLLDRLEALARTPTGEVKSADDLQLALRKAEDDYVAAMDLRRRLEDAIRGG